MKYFFGLLLFTSLANAAPIAPAPIPGGFVPSGNVRVFLRQEELAYYAEIAAASETDGRQVEELTAGAYYQLWDHLKVGAFYRRAYGLRHDADWVNTGPGQWSWENTNGRGENFFILDATPKLQLSFLPSGNWVGELKVRLLNDFFNHQDTLFVRPGLTYFLLKDERPFINFFLQYELDFPLNYGVRTVYDQWIYLGALHPLTHSFNLGAYGALNWETWGNTQSFVTLGGTPYAFTTQTFVVGVVGVLQFDL